jgi:hypothetical protein
MSIPGFSAEAIFEPPRAIARQTGGGGGGGTIIIDGNCKCIRTDKVCLPPFGPFCLPFLGCFPVIELCLERCAVYRCTPN